MCTVIVRVAPGTPWPVTLLALRDESPDRPWDPLGAWWPTIDDTVRGVHDRSAGGAWLAGSDRTGSLAVVLNRDLGDVAIDAPTTRGALPIEAVVRGVDPTGTQTSRPYNLVRADVDGVRVTSWDGVEVRTEQLGPGVHMITEAAPDDVGVPRIARWLEAFRAVEAPAVPPRADPLGGGADPADGADGADSAAAGSDAAWDPWLGVFAASAVLAPTDPAAIIRDNTGAEGRFATLSVVSAAVGADGVVMRHSRLAEPARIDPAPIDSGTPVRHA